MNIVFWFLVIVGIVLLWFLLSSCFGELGEMIINIFNGVKEEIEENYDENEDE